MPPHRPTRQLNPYPSNTTECLTSCSPDCLFYDLCHDPHPDPLPHPLPSLPAPPQPSSTSIHLHHFPRLLLALLIPSAILVFVSVLFVVLCLFYGYRRHRRILNQNLAPAPLPVHINPPDLGPDSDQHYVWYIRTVGLDDSAIRAISARCYKAGDDGGASMAGCTVCLGEFHEGELLRLLPKCGHAFHVSCIDTWLRAHANCPLCRAAVVVPQQNGFPLPPSSPSDTGDELSDSEMLNLGDGSAIGNGVSSLSTSTQPVRRSASMGSIECKGESFDEGSASNSKELKGCVGLEVELVRSWSCGGDKFFLSRHGRG